MIFISNIHLLLQGTIVTLYLSLGAIFISTIMGVLLALAQIYTNIVFRFAVETFLFFVRGVPLLVLLFAMYYLLPFTGLSIDPTFGGMFVIGVYFSAFMCEVFRGAILGVPRGQVDAGRALGMYGQNLLVFVIVPQALKLIGPPFINTCIMVVKGTALVSIIGLLDLTFVGRQIVERTLAPFQIFGGVAAIYFVICYGLSLLGRYLERRTSYVH